VDVTTHLRGRACQAGAFLAVIGVVLSVAPAPAQAAAPSVGNVQVSNANLQSGQQTAVTYTVTNNNAAGENADIDIVVSSNRPELTCSGDSCNFTANDVPGGESKTFTAQMVVGQMESGASENATIAIRATVDGLSKTATRGVTIRGDNRSPTVREIKGKVRDNEGKSVSGAEVGLLDSARHSYKTRTNGSGNYKFTSTDQQPIAIGQVTVGAQIDGFTPNVVNVNGTAGASLTVDIKLALSAEATPSATPSASPTPSSDVTVEPTEADPTTDTKIEPQPAAGADSDDEGSSSLIFIILGGLLVAAGIGAIVLVLMRRKEGDTPDDPDGEDDRTALGARSTPTPPSQGRYGGAADATRVANRGADATMLAGAPVRPSLSDAPTMLQQAVPADEFPDPYGAPAAVPHAGYAAAGTAGWGAAAVPAPAPAATPYGAPAPGAYGAASPAAPTSVYGAPAAPGGAYGVPAQSAPPTGYGAAAPNPYGRPPAQPGGGAYGAPAAEPYGRPSSGAGYDGRPQSGAPHGGPPPGASYGATDQQRYDEPTGRYDPAAAPGHAASGYDAPGYGAPGYGAPGYDAQGYEQPGGYQGGGYRGGDQGRGGPQDAGRSPDLSGPGGFRQQPAPEVPYQAGGGYSAPSGGGYASAAGGGYQAEPEQANPYGSWSPGAGIDSGNAYGAPAGGDYGRGGYGNPAPAAPGYDEPTGYDPRGTYGRPDGYDRAPEQQPGRAPQQPGGYDEPGYYGAEQQQPPQGGRHGGNPQEPRRPLDWLDD
jgi:hypothetical protein